MRVALVDHGMGNLRSVARALEAAGARVTLSSDAREMLALDGLCVPGQGIFGRCMEAVDSSGAADAIRTFIDDDRPFIGICLGMQILFEVSEEGESPGLGIVAGKVTRLPPSVTVPHIGWNTVDGEYYYFDHSYAAHPDDASIVDGWCEHGEEFAASLRRAAMVATQYHPEKSGRAGIALLRRWVNEA